ERQTYDIVAALSSYSENYLRKDAGPKLWRDLSAALGEPISKRNFKAALERQWEQTQRALTASSLADSQKPSLNLPTDLQADWGEVIDVSVFFGRLVEQETLIKWATTERCRLILILGMGGIGKTALAIKVGQQLETNFDCVLWRSLQNAPPLLELLGDCIKVLSQRQDVQIPITAEAGISQLLQYLRKRRCLLILDNAESLLQAGDHKRRYRTAYEGYGQLFQKIGETVHLSCVIVTSRELPQGLEGKIGLELPTRSLSIGGLLRHDGQALLTSIAKFQGSTAEWETILQHYAGNPLALRIVASFVNEVLAGDLSQFCALLGHSSFLFDDIRDLLEQQFLRLSSQEQAVMMWLAIRREPVNLTTLSGDLLEPISPPELLQVVMALQSRALIEKTNPQFTLQPVVMEYVTDYLIDLMGQQICHWQANHPIHNLSVLQGYALLLIDSQEYVRETQVRLILTPLLDKLLAELKKPSTVEQRFQDILETLRKHSPQAKGYGAGNLFNLLRALQVDFSGYDFSHLTLWQANLQGISLHHVDFSDADLSKTQLNQNFGGIVTLACHPESQFLASGDTKGNIILWRMLDGQSFHILRGHKAWVACLAFSPDGRTLVSGGIDYTLRLWDVQTGQCIRIMLGHESALYSVAFSPDSQKVASGGEDYKIKLWDAKTGECLQTFQGHTQPVRSVVFSPDGRSLVSASFDQTVRIWDLQSAEITHILHGHSAPVWSVDISPDAGKIASCSADQTIRVWDISTGVCLSVLQNTSDALSVVFAPNGLTFATTGLDKIIRVWNAESGQCLHTLPGHTDQAWAIVFHPNGESLISGSIDQTIRLWDVETGHCNRIWYGYSHYICSLAFSEDGTTLVSAGDDGVVRLWNWEDGNQFKALMGHKSGLFTVAFHPNNRLLATGGYDKAIWLWDIQTQQCLRQMRGMTEWTYSVAFHPGGQLLATSGIVPLIWFWDVGTGQCLQPLQGHRSAAWSVAFSPDGNQLASASADCTVKVWDVTTGDCVHTLTGHDDWLYAVATLTCTTDTETTTDTEPTGYYIASAGADRMIRIWDSQTGDCLRVLAGHTDWIYAIAAHPSGQYIASASHDGTVRHWDLRSGTCLAILAHGAPLWSVAYHPQGELLASCGWNNRILIWDLSSKQNIQTLEVYKPYHGMLLRNCKGLTGSQLLMLQDLGATV
ncbi:MAG TPA: NB-ARC domain-containing protein, partial [Stenomitos sp.]